MNVTTEQPPRRSSGPHQGTNWRSVAIITAAAFALYAGMRSLPTGTNLSHMDFKPGGSAVEFCDPSNPQFMPVVNVKSPVVLGLSPAMPTQHSGQLQITATLTSASGKPVGPEDLLVVHTARLHLMLIDPSLSDYQHVHPQPGESPGQWTFAFTPRRTGLYRVYADFTPAATARGLYAAADLNVIGTTDQPRRPAEEILEPLRNEQEGLVFALEPPNEARAGQPLDLAFEVRRGDGGEVLLEPVMDAFAHLVAFDSERTGFAHLHPKEVDLSKPPDARNPLLTFQVTFPRPGRYVIWAQTKIKGRERFAPFSLEVGR